MEHAAAAAPRGPLSGLRVLDLSRVLAGPLCTQVLSDLGAGVIKVERPGTGDDTRSWGPPWAEGPGGRESAYFLCANRGKRSIVADLATEAGRAEVRRLAREADVLVDNFAPGAMDRWGLGYEALAAENPGLVACSITGYASDGPEAGRPGYDFALQARTGWMAITGGADDPPVKAGVAVVDVLTGQFAAVGILAALRERDRTGRGQRLEVPLFDAALAGLVNVAQAALVTGREPGRWGNAHATIVPYQAFAASDRALVVAVGNDAQWMRLCRAVGVGELAEDPRLATNPGRIEHRARVVEVFSGVFRTAPAAHWLEVLDGAGVPCAPVQGVREALADPAYDGSWEMEGPTYGRVATVPSPIRLSRTPAGPGLPAPALGEHTVAVARDGWGRSGPGEPG